MYHEKKCIGANRELPNTIRWNFVAKGEAECGRGNQTTKKIVPDGKGKEI